MLDRATGTVATTYRKQFPCCVAPSGAVGTDGYPSREGTTTVDLKGIGRVGLLTCYDANFPEVKGTLSLSPFLSVSLSVSVFVSIS